ncbi:MAG TPA: RidA family protein [Acidimicrobiia bacterium]|nr:RidA family protein [Acidimicrobiia bacterium]
MRSWIPIDVDGGMKHASSPQAVRAGDFVFLSSVRGVDPATQKPIEDPLTQFRQGFDNIRVVLAGAGLDLPDIVKLTIYLKAPAQNRASLDQAWSEAFPGTPPARATIRVEGFGAGTDPTLAFFDVVAYGPGQ